LVFKRSKRYHSVLRPQILDSDFPRDGKAYIDNIYNTYGIDTDIGCEIQYLDKSDTTYKTLFDGLIDLSEWTSLRDVTVVKIADNSTMAKFAARDEVEIPTNRLTDLSGGTMEVYTFLSTMNVEPVDIWERALFDDSTNTNTIFSLGRNTPFTDYYGVSNGSLDINEIGSDATLPAVTLGSASGPLYTNNESVNVDVQFRIKTRFVGSITVAATLAWTWSLEAFTGKNGATTAISITDSGSGNKTTNFDTSYDSGDLTATLAPGETIEIYHKFNATGADAQLTYTFDMKPIYTEVFKITRGATATDVDMPLIHELGAKLLESMTGLEDPLNAPLLGRTDSEPRTYLSDGSYSLIGVANGNMLRGFDFQDKPLISSFADYFKSIDAMFNLGCWYDADNTEFVIAAKGDFYDGTTKIITLGEVKDLEISVAQEEYFNIIKSGYRNKLDFEDVNGNQNFNVPGEFANDGERIQNTLDLQSAYHADDYGIELSRKADSISTNSTDTKHDNQRFIIYGKRSGGDYQTLQGFDDFTVITGLYSPATRLNLNITPKRNLLRQDDVLSIPLFKSSGDTNFMNNQYEVPLETQKSGGSLIKEKDDIAYSGLDEPLYYPEYYNFTAPLTNTIVTQLISNPHGYVEFTYEGTTYKGFIEEVSTEPFLRRGNWTLKRLNPNR
jgi:hypothetical protein